jgi:hypothetical protein
MRCKTTFGRCTVVMDVDIVCFMASDDTEIWRIDPQPIRSANTIEAQMNATLMNATRLTRSEVATLQVVVGPDNGARRSQG